MITFESVIQLLFLQFIFLDNFFFITIDFLLL